MSKEVRESIKFDFDKAETETVDGVTTIILDGDIYKDNLPEGITPAIARKVEEYNIDYIKDLTIASSIHSTAVMVKTKSINTVDTIAPFGTRSKNDNGTMKFGDVTVHTGRSRIDKIPDSEKTVENSILTVKATFSLEQSLNLTGGPKGKFIKDLKATMTKTLLG